jgi:hypothetical protein
MSNLAGLQLTKAERIIVIALSYLYCAPLFYYYSKRLQQYLSNVSTRVRERREARELAEWEVERRRYPHD